MSIDWRKSVCLWRGPRSSTTMLGRLARPPGRARPAGRRRSSRRSRTRRCRRRRAQPSPLYGRLPSAVQLARELAPVARSRRSRAAPCPGGPSPGSRTRCRSSRSRCVAATRKAANGTAAAASQTMHGRVARRRARRRRPRRACRTAGRGTGRRAAASAPRARRGTPARARRSRSAGCGRAAARRPRRRPARRATPAIAFGWISLPRSVRVRLAARDQRVGEGLQRAVVSEVAGAARARRRARRRSATGSAESTRPPSASTVARLQHLAARQQPRELRSNLRRQTAARLAILAVDELGRLRGPLAAAPILTSPSSVWNGASRVLPGLRLTEPPVSS